MIFPPEQQVELRDTLRQGPLQFGLEQSRWTLKAIGLVVTWLGRYSLSGICRILKALQISYKRGRHHVHSPDPHYNVKKQWAEQCEAEAKANPGKIVTVYMDEVSFYRQPTLASDWCPTGSDYQPLAERAVHKTNTRSRVVGALDVVTGQVTYRQRSKIGVDQLCAFYRQLRDTYPEAERIYVIQDNWYNVHFHPEVIDAALDLGIIPVPLPTYAPWLNPTEKLWRKLYQEIIHLHRLSNQWEELKACVNRFLDQFAPGSPELLHYVGLLPN